MKEKVKEQKRAFIYCRTSEDAEEEEDSKKVSIETQEETGRELAKRHGYKVLEVFQDRNRSGRLYPTGFLIPDPEVENYCNECNYSAKSRTRDKLGELLKRIREIEVIIVRRADRLMRPLPLSKLDAHVLTILKQHNVIIHSHDDSIINPSNPEHVFIFKVTSTIHSKYVADRRDETKIGIRKIRDEGKLYFPPSFYGYRTDGYQKAKRIENEITIVERIFKEFLAGNTLKGIARGLNSPPNPIPTLKNKGMGKDGKGFWLDCTIRAILKRPQYAGFQYKSNGTDMVQVPAFQPPVISMEKFREVQDKMLDRKRDRSGNTKTIHGLGGLLVCGHCGYKLYTTATYLKSGDNKTHKVESFRCINYTKSKGPCACKGVQIKERFPKGLKRRDGVAYSNGLEDCLFPLIYKGYINHLVAKNRRVGLDDEIEECMTTLERNENHKKSLGQKLRDNLIDDKTFDTLIKDTIDAESKIKIKLQFLQKEANAIDRNDVPKSLYADYASHKIPDDLKRRLFHSVIEKILVFHQQIDVHLKDGGKFTIPRIRMGKTYVLPSWRIVESNKDSHTTLYTSNGVSRVKYKPTPINEDTAINVVYEYDNNQPWEIIYNDPNLTVMSEGTKKDNRRP